MKRQIEEFGQVLLMGLCALGLTVYMVSPWIAVGLA